MTPTSILTHIREADDTPASRLPRGRVFRVGRGEHTWSLMNRKHFRRVTQIWWEAGYEAGRAAAEKPLTAALRRNGA